MNSLKKIIILLVLLCPAILFAQTKIFVSAKGNDANAGTQAKPFASIKRALTEAQKKSGPVVVYLSGGTYYLKQPVVFTSKDSRRENERLTITSGKNQKAIISGGTPLKDLNWKKYKNGIWQTKIHQDLVFDELFVNGQLQRMARYPNYDSTARFLGGTAADAVSKERAAGWKSPEGGYVHALHRAEWGDFHYVITGKDSSGQLTLEGGWQNNRRMGMHKKYRFVENIFEELDTVNEWYYNKETKTLYYYPPDDIGYQNCKI